ALAVISAMAGAHQREPGHTHRHCDRCCRRGERDRRRAADRHLATCGTPSRNQPVADRERQRRVELPGRLRVPNSRGRAAPALEDLVGAPLDLRTRMDDGAQLVTAMDPDRARDEIRQAHETVARLKGLEVWEAPMGEDEPAEAIYQSQSIFTPRGTA